MIIARYEGPAPRVEAPRVHAKCCERCGCTIVGRVDCAKYCHPCADVAQQMVKARYNATYYYTTRRPRQTGRYRRIT